MNTTRLPDPIYITEHDSFHRMIESLAQVEKLAVDTEANSLYAYQERVCLIQLSTPNHDYIVDPLALDELDPLGEIFNDPAVEKIFHASEFDILILYDDFGFQFQNLFDTMLAARILGRKNLGLDALLEDIAGVQINKKFQRADWGQRPLPEDMLRYAQMDTHYLIQIRNALAEKLHQSGRWPIAQEDFARACRVHARPQKEKLPPCWQIHGAQDLSPRKAAILEKLCQYRDRVARKEDQPLFKVLGNKTLLALADAAPRTQQAFESLSILSQPQVQRHKHGLWEAIQAGWKANPLLPPERERPDDAFLTRLHHLKTWRKRKARQVGVNSAVILPRYLLTAVAEQNPSTKEELGEILSEVPLRFTHYGEEILAALSHK
jgi:ribonuclease D